MEHRGQVLPVYPPGHSGRGTGVLEDAQAYAWGRRRKPEAVQTLPYSLLSLKTDARGAGRLGP